MKIHALEGRRWRGALAFVLKVLPLPCTFRSVDIVASRTPRSLGADGGAGSEAFVGERIGLKSVCVLLMLSHKVGEVGGNGNGRCPVSLRIGYRVGGSTLPYKIEDGDEILE